MKLKHNTLFWSMSGAIVGLFITALLTHGVGFDFGWHTIVVALFGSFLLAWISRSII